MKYNEEITQNVIMTEYSELMKQAYIDYAMSVIVSRAIPDVRDGLKPVQRRTLFDMHELGLTYDKQYKKSARVVGDTMGKYHPHGDSSIYEALVIMSQDFKKGAALVDGHGNFGSIEGDGAAAMRYTECRLQKLAQEALLSDLDKDVVDFVANFDDSLLEPEVLPSRLPNILINGSEGIAVGMTTSIPTHNIGESIDALILSIKKPDATLEELMEAMPGPDFPTGALIINKSDLLEIYATGSGRLKLRGKAEIVPDKAGKEKIVITEIPYTMIGNGINQFLMKIEELSDSKLGGDIVGASNQSSKDGIKIVIELKKGADSKQILNVLYSKTKLEDTFSVNMLAVSGKQPKLMGLVEIFNEIKEFQKEIHIRKYSNLLKKEQEKSEVQEGLLKAIDVIDAIIATLRGAKNISDVKNCLIQGDTSKISYKSKEYEKIASNFKFTQRQANAILEMRLQKLIGLEVEELIKARDITLNNIKTYEELLSDENKLKKQIINELLGLKKQYARPRRTALIDAKEAQNVSVPVKEQDITVIIDKLGYIRAVDRATYEKNSENIIDESRFIEFSKNTGRICCFTDTGKLHIIRCDEIPIGRIRDKGKALDTVSNVDSMSENIIYVRDMDQIKDLRLLFVTQLSMLKRVDGIEFDVVSKRSIVATKLNTNDKLVCIREIQDGQNVALRTKSNIFLRFDIKEISLMKKNAAGVRGMRLERNDYLIDAYVFEPIDNLDTVRNDNISSLPLFSMINERDKFESNKNDAEIQGENIDNIGNEPVVITQNELRNDKDDLITREWLSTLRLARRDTKGSKVKFHKK